MQHHSRKPEVKSPAGYWPHLEAAVEAGADAVYFGLKHFTARAKAGFELSELPRVLDALHKRGVHGYVTFNTLIFEHELAEAARVIARIAEAGTDGLIVQDVAAIRLAREIAPDLALHGSTQMSITDARGVEFARSLGVDRVTLARELSFKEIGTVINEAGGELEIFCHGALCVAYSGQCYSSEAWGGRSANRGQCAQACRLSYDLMIDGNETPLGDARYLLSPGDLYALRQIPEIIQAGVAALKIEGRYKDAEYVALTTRAYRKAVDEAWEGRPLSVTATEEQQLEQVYSRGLGPYFLTGTDHQAVVRGRAPRHRGVLAGRVVSNTPMGVVIEIDSEVQTSAAQPVSLKPGDGIVFDSASWRSPDEPEEGGRIYEVVETQRSVASTRQTAKTLELRFGNGAIHPYRIRKGDLVWRTHDPALDQSARVFTHASSPVAKQTVNVHVDAFEGKPLVSRWSLERDAAVSITVESAETLIRAQNRGIQLDLLEQKFARLGNTAYQLGSVTLSTGGSPFAPASLLNQLRRDAVAQLVEIQSRPPVRKIHDPESTLHRILRPPKEQGNADQQHLHLLVRNAEQLDAALALRPSSVTLDYLDLYGLKPSVERVKEMGIPARVASPRILKPGETRIAEFLLRLECPLLVRHSGLLHAIRDKSKKLALTGDFSLNAASSISAGVFLELGLDRLTPGHDLNAAQVADLARHIGAERLEVIAYQHLPVFHTEHCVFARFLSSGHDYRDCGRPCERHRVEIRDQSKRPHPVVADVGCRNTVFGAEAQEVSRHFELWRGAGIRHWRLEFVHESADQVTTVTRAFMRALEGNSSALAAALRKAAPHGTTEGSLFVAEGYSQLPILQ